MLIDCLRLPRFIDYLSRNYEPASLYHMTHRNNADEKYRYGK